MTTHSGQSGVVKVGSTTVAEVKSFSVEESSEVLEDTAQGDTTRTYKAGLKSWTVSLEALWDPDDTGGQDALTNGASVTLELYPWGTTSGDTYLTGAAIITSRSVNSEMEGIVSMSISGQGTGALTETTVSP